MSAQDIYQIARLVVSIFERLGVNYEIGGSIASSLHGKPRSTLDADIVAELLPTQAGEFVRLLGAEFYADAEAIAEAVRRQRSFNVIHLPSMLKVDVFPVKDDAFARVEFSRRVQVPFPDPSGAPVWVSSPEDIILHKLAWYAAGGQVADRQLQDAIGVLRVWQGRLDLAYLRHWAAALKVSELLDKALAAGSPSDSSA
jgi:hypothetical protein